MNGPGPGHRPRDRWAAGPWVVAAVTASVGVAVLAVVPDASVIVALLISTVAVLSACLVVAVAGYPLVLWAMVLATAGGWVPLLIALSLTGS